MKREKLTKSKVWTRMGFVLIAGLLVGYFLPAPAMTQDEHAEMLMTSSIPEQRVAWMSVADNIRGDLSLSGKYNCCLENPCWYCIQKTPGHGEGAECECLNDILNGEHPCGECIGEIMEGHGNKDPEIVKLYAKAIAHKVGDQHTDHLREIIADMYDMPVEEQL